MPKFESLSPLCTSHSLSAAAPSLSPSSSSSSPPSSSLPPGARLPSGNLQEGTNKCCYVIERLVMLSGTMLQGGIWAPLAMVAPVSHIFLGLFSHQNPSPIFSSPLSPISLSLSPVSFSLDSFYSFYWFCIFKYYFPNGLFLIQV